MDALVAGINPGWNLCEAPFKVSGTAGAAQVAVERGLLGVAVSAGEAAAARQYADIAAATRRLVQAIRGAFDPLPAVLLNVNVPETFGPDTAVRLTRPSRDPTFSEFGLHEYAADEQGINLRVRLGDFFGRQPQPGDEMHALAEGAVSIAVTGRYPKRRVAVRAVDVDRPGVQGLEGLLRNPKGSCPEDPSPQTSARGDLCVTESFVRGRPLTDFRRRRRNLPLPLERVKNGAACI